jgi:hypothetical protein
MVDTPMPSPMKSIIFLARFVLISVFNVLANLSFASSFQFVASEK